MEKVIIKSDTVWYNGRVATVKDRNMIAGITVLWVAVDGTNVEFAIREENVEAV